MDQEKWLSKLLIVALLLGLPSACSPVTITPIEGSTAIPSAEPTSTPVVEPTPTALRPTPVLPESAPDLIFYNGVLLTMGQDRPQAQAIAILGDRILAAGSDEEVLALGGPETEVIDLQGRTLTPGFVDSHSHRIPQRYKWEFSTPEEAIQAALAQGRTGLDELHVTQDDIDEFHEVDARGELRLRVNAYLLVNTFDGQPLGGWFSAYRPGQQFSPHLRIAGLKIFIDYDSGRTLLFQQDELNELVRRLQSEGWQISMKVISIQSHELALNAYEYALNGASNHTYRHRIEHSVAVTDEQLARMARLGIIACIQPSLPGVMSYDPDIYRMADEHGTDSVFRWRDYHDGGVFMIASPLNPTGAEEELTLPTHISPAGLLYRSVTQIGIKGRLPDAWMLEKTLAVDQIMPLLTINGAYATFEEDVKGSLASGKYADLVILSENPLTVPVEGLPDIRALMTMVGGNVEWCAEGAESLCGQSHIEVPEATEGMIVVQPGGAIEIAVQRPATGALADLYPHLWNVAQMAIADYGLVLGEFPITLVQVDDGCDKPTGTSAAEQLLTDYPRVVGVIGPLCSRGVMGSLPIYRQESLVSVSGSATWENLSVLFGAGGFNRTVLNDGQMRALGLSEDCIDELASVQDLYARYESQHRPLPAEIRPLMAYTYDAAQVLLNAIEDAAILGEYGGISIERSALADAVRSTQDFTGLTGPIAFDEDGDRIPVNLPEE